MPPIPQPPGSLPGANTGGGIDWRGFADAALPWVQGILSTGGDIYSSQQNRAEAERNRQFQERMSSSAVQRSVEDYKKAGLNPGLAYDRSASSPGGAQATIGNPITSGIASANAAKQLALATRQTDADVGLKQRQAEAALAANKRDTAAADLNASQSRLAEQQFHFNNITQPITRKLMETDAVMRALAIPEAKNKAQFEELLGTMKPGLASAKTFAEVLRLMFK